MKTNELSKQVQVKKECLHPGLIINNNAHHDAPTTMLHCCDAVI